MTTESPRRETYKAPSTEMGFTHIHDKHVIKSLNQYTHPPKQLYGFYGGMIHFYGPFVDSFDLSTHHCVLRIESQASTDFVIIHSRDGLKMIIEKYKISTGISGIDDERVHLMLLTHVEYTQVRDALDTPRLVQKDLVGSW
jgi:hypothetical protein